MANFDPNKSYGGEVLPSGEYLLAMTMCERKESRQNPGRYYMRARFKVIAGASKGASFFSSVGIDTSSQGTAARLSLYCKAVGQLEAFDVDSDAAFEAAFLGKPFKAKIKTTQNGQYTNNDIERYVLTMTNAENEICEEFWVEWLDTHDAASGDDGDPGYSDDDAPAPRSQKRQHDDDIPF